MALFDDLREIAKKRDNYDPVLAQQTYLGRQAPTPSRRRPSSAPGSRSNAPRSPYEPMGADELERYREAGQRRIERLRTSPVPASSSSGGKASSPLGSIGNFVLDAAMLPLKALDQGRQIYQGTAGEVGDFVAGKVEDWGLDDKWYGDIAEAGMNIAGANYFQMRGLREVDPETGKRTGERDTSFDWGNINDGDMADGFLGRIDWDDSLPGVVRFPVGVAGDLFTDPTMYATFGTAGVVNAAARGGAKAIARQGARSALPAARKVLAQRASLKLGDDAVVKAVGKETIKNVTRNVGKYGRGALTRKGMKRGGYTADDLAKMGMQDNFKYTVGVGGARTNIALTGRAAEASENIKGAIKAWNASTGLATKSRKIFNTEFENRMRTAILKGSPDAPTAARGLAVLGRASGDANRWTSESLHEASKFFKKLEPEDAKLITQMIESGQFVGDLGSRAKTVADFLKKSGDTLQAAGVPFSMRQGYVPHRATKEARYAAKGGDESVSAALGFDPAKREAFQNARGSNLSIDEINTQWRATGKDYDLLETDVRILTEEYIREGQEAYLRAGLTGGEAQRLGLVDDMGFALKNGGVQKAVAEQADQAMKSLADGARQRAAALKAGRKSLTASRKDLSGQVRAASVRLDKASKAVAASTKRHATAQQKLEALEATADGLRAQLKTASASEKRKLTRRLNELDGRRPEYKQNLQSARTRLTKRQGDYNELRRNVSGAKAELEQHDSIIRALSEERALMNKQAVTTDAVKAEANVVKAEAAIKKQQEDFVNPRWDEVEAASQTKAWATADANQLNSRISMAIGRIDEWVDDVKNLPGRGTSDGVLEYANQVTEQMRVLKKLLKENPDRSTLNDVLRLEAQAVEADMTAILAARTQRAIEKAVANPTDESLKNLLLKQKLQTQVGVLKDVDFQKMIMEQTKDGFERLAREGADDVQINKFYSEAISTLDQKLDFGDMNKWLDKYLGAQNWWKGQALASPGFLVRNGMGGMFNMYLDDIPVQYAIRFRSYEKKLLDEGRDAAQQWATKKHGSTAARQLDEAATVAAATGDGQAASEAAGKILGSSSKKLNVFSSQHALPSWSRRKSSNIESGLRGGHAYGVLAQGGDYGEALSRVEKFHFNYQNLGKGDEVAKLVSPFWTFFSRNLALQMQVYAKRPGKLTRSYYNTKRNIEEGFGFNEDKEFTPWYMGDGLMQGIRTGLSPLGKEVGPLSLTPDIPAVRYPGQIASMADGLATDPFGEIAGQLGPQVKVPYEMLANKSTFTGNDYNNSLTEWSDGGMKGRSAPGWIDQPGLRNILNLLPGTEIIDDTLLMQDNTEAALIGAHPYASRLLGMSGDSSANPASGWNARLGFGGGLGRFNSPSAQESAQYFEQKMDVEEYQKALEAAALERLVRNGG